MKSIYNLPTRQTSTVDRKSLNKIKGQDVYNVRHELIQHIVNSIGHSKVELLHLINIDKGDRVLSSRIISVGTINHVNVLVRQVVEHVFKDETYSIIIAHNHTSGNITPSWYDVTYTRSLNKALHHLDVLLVDHFIASPIEVFSLRRNCLLF